MICVPLELEHDLCAAAAGQLSSVEPVKAELDSDSSTNGGSDDLCSECSDDDWDSWTTPLSVSNTITIADWDDTILPTTWLEAQGLRLNDKSKPTEEQMGYLQAMAQQAMHTLEIAKMHGTVVLVTNAEEGWVQLSCQKFMPSLYASLQDLKIISARSTYERQGVVSASEWKYLAFKSEVHRFCESCITDERTNIISVGDSPYERAAVIRVANCLPNACVKSLKFAGHPDVDLLLKQHELISGCFHELVNYEGNLDLCIR